MRHGWLVTGIMVGVALAAATLVPSVRQAGRAFVLSHQLGGMLDWTPWDRLSVVERAVRTRPDEAVSWLRYAERGSALGQTSALAARLGRPAGRIRAAAPKDIEAAYERALALAPTDSAPRLRYALYLAGSPPSEERPPDPLPPRVPQLLAEVRLLDPTNAMPDYLEASLDLQQGHEAEARTALARAEAKPRLDSYDRAVAMAVLRQWDSLLPSSRTAFLAASEVKFTGLNSHLRRLAVELRTRATRAHEAGREDEAIADLTAIILLGYRLRAQAFSTIDGLVGAAILPLATAWNWPTREELAPQTQGMDGEEVFGLERRVGAERLAAYLRQHGRDDWASFWEREWPAAVRFHDQSRRMIADRTLAAELWPQAPIWSLSFLVEAAADLLLAVGLLMAALSLPLRVWREGSRRPPWTWPQWALLLPVLVLPTIPLAVFSAWRASLYFPVLTPSPAPWIRAARVASVVLWLLVVLVAALLKRRRQPPERRLGRARAYLASLRALLPPTVAAVLLLVVLLLPVAGEQWRRDDAQYRQRMVQGEVAYWGLNDEAPPGEAAPALPPVLMTP